MNKLNPELEEQVQALAKICCQVLKSEDVDLEAQSTPIIESLAHGGYGRLSDTKLAVRIGHYATQQCMAEALHRKVDIQRVAGEMQKILDSLETWKANSPNQEPSAPKAANISSTTER